MRKKIVAAVVGVSLAAAAFALPAELVVVSAKEVRPDEAAGLYYLGSCRAGYLYNGSSAALGRVAPYRLLDREGQAKDYYIVWPPSWVKVSAADFAHLGTAVRLSENEILVGLERGLGPGALRAVEHRIELIKLEPVTPVEWSFDGEEPPKKKDPRIEVAVNSINAEEYAGYIRRLQDFKTRRTETKGCDAARDYVRDFFAAQKLEPSLFPFRCMRLREAYYPIPGGKIYIRTDHSTFKRSKDNGNNWDTIWAKGLDDTLKTYWVDNEIGFVGCVYNNIIMKTQDGGDNWEKLVFGDPNLRYRVFAMYFVTPATGWIGGDVLVGTYAGFIFKTTDGGRTWVEQKVPLDFWVYGLEFFDVNHGWAAGGKEVMHTSDGGTTWRACSGVTTRITDIAGAGPNKAWATDGTSCLLRTTDGLNWVNVEPGVAGNYNEIEFPDGKRGYAAGTKLIATDDGGATWREVKGAPVTEYSVLAFADERHGVAGDEYGEHLYRTDDGGASFKSIINDMDLTAENVIGERRGGWEPDEIVIIGGHFDSISDTDHSTAPGAEDDASGTACAMAAARALRDIPFKRTVRYVAFGDEEGGCVGSRYYAEDCARRGDKIVAVLNADMVSYDEDKGARDDFAVAHNNEKYRWLYDYLVRVGGLYGNDLIYDSVEWAADHTMFWDVGYAAVGVIEGGKGPGGRMEYPYYHTTEDTLDKLHPALGVRFCLDYAATLAHLAGVGPMYFEPGPPGWAAVPFTRPFAVYPNPYCYATCTGGVNFVGLRSPATVEIYDLAGRRVAREQVAGGCDECVWRPTTPEGETLAPGVYVYRVEGQEQGEAGKIVVSK
jgi:photosystem II stability/assembly factor-like uncharacterized protein